MYIGDTTSGELRGFGLSWPAGLPRDRPRRNTVMAMITTEPADLRALESDSHLARGSSGPRALPEHHAPLASGVPRGGRTPARYTILWRDCLLYPFDGPLVFGAPA